MAARINVTDPDGKNRWFTLESGESLTVGRGTESDIIALDRLVSRRHCTIAATDDGYAVRDLHSVNGTYCNGRRIEMAQLEDGAKLQAGNTKITLTLPWVAHGTAVSSPRAGRFLKKAALFAVAVCLMAGAAVGGSHLVKMARKTAFATGSRMLSVNSSPEQAMVLVDDRYVGHTPVPGVSISTGRHSIRVVKADYQDWTYPVEEGDGSVSVEASLVSNVSGLLLITSSPDGASVFLDGERVGVTPLKLTKVAVGERDVRLQKTNYVSVFERVTIKPSQEKKLEFPLTPRQAETYIALLKKDPNNCSYHCELAHVYLLEQKIKPARRHLEKALDIYAKGEDTSDYAKRLAWLFEKIYANNYFHWADSTADLEKMRDEVDLLFLEVMSRHPDNKRLPAWLAEIHSEAERPFNVKVLKRFLKVQPDAGIRASIATATRLARQGKTNEATEILEMATEAAPHSFAVFYTVGKIHYRAAVKGNKSAINDAMIYLTKARDLCGDNKAKQHQIDAYLHRLEKLKKT